MVTDPYSYTSIIFDILITKITTITTHSNDTGPLLLLLFRE